MKMRTLIIMIIMLIIIVTISIIYTTIPRLELNGIQNMTISYRKQYEEPGVIIKNASSKNLNKVKIEDNIENATIGTYYVDYTLKLGSRTLKKRRNVKIIDDIQPIIKLEGNQITEISLNEDYKEPGYKAYDEYDGDLTDKVDITGKVDTKNYGEYIIKYKVKDNSNNAVEVNRIVKVIDEEAPKIICESEYSAFEIKTENIIGCKAIDNFDGDITDKLKIKGEHDTNKKGIYNIEYEVEDDSKNKTTINHNIIIYERNDKESEAYVVITDEKELKEMIEQNEIKASILTQKNIDEEYIKELEEKNYQIGIRISNNTFKTIEELEKYCTNNNIKIIKPNELNNPQEMNNQLNNTTKKIIIINEKTNIQNANTIIQLLKEMKYNFNKLENLK